MPQPAAKPAAPFNLPQALARALALHGQGKLAEAERLYAAILAARPEHVDALQMMGLVKLAKGEPAEALKLVSAAMGGRKPSPQLLLNHGLILNALARHGEALDSFDAALRQKSKFAEAHNNRGAALAALGRDEEALDSYRKAAAIKPDYAEAHYNAGSALRTLGRMDEALASFERALARRPNYAKAHNNRGAVLEAQGKLAPALESYEKALALLPGFSEARRNRCRVLCQFDRFDEALAALDEALALKPGNADMLVDRGRVLLDLNRNDDAAADFARALALRPDDATARLAACFAELPILYADENEVGRRRAAYAAKLSSLTADAEAGRLRGDWTKALAIRQPFLLAYQGACDRNLQALYGGMVSRLIGAQFGDAPLPPPPGLDEPVRVGVVSSFFFLHSNWKIPIKGWLSQLDRRRFKIFGYHTGARRDAETDLAAALCDRFVHRTLDVAGWRREILADAPHVLIYPGLWMDNVTFQLAAQRLAPVQCNSWGHPETGGMATLDYFLSSDLMEPPGAEAHYTEKLVRLPNLSIYYEPPGIGPEQIGRAELGLCEDAAVFWCGQSLYKYLPQHDAVFARVARAAGNCQFVFLRHNGGPSVTELFQARLERAFAAEGLKAADHCVFLPRLSQSRFAAAIGLCDVFLDSIGWSGCNSALESLAYDVPIVTLRGDLMRGRHSAAILEMMDVTDTIATTVEDYIALAVRLARDPAERQALRTRIAAAKPALYRDGTCIARLADFLDAAARRPAESAA
jgi:predicted O-linked N-acetylglucosamine transferase (SPINDLY family)